MRPRANPGRAARQRDTPQRIRIIGGAWRRTPIPVLRAAGLRPTPDRVRETLFNWLAHLCGDLHGVRGLDLFAGSGALGLELASRGAAQVVLVERQSLLLRQLRALRDKLAAAQVDIIAGDALAVAASLPRGGFDLVFLDPPFGEDLLSPAIDATRPLLARGGLIYAETDAPIDDATAVAHDLDVIRAARAGRVCFHLLQPRNA